MNTPDPFPKVRRRARRSEARIASPARSAVNREPRADEPPRSNPARDVKTTLVSRTHHRPLATNDANAIDTHTYHSYDQIDAHPYPIHRKHTKMHRLACTVPRVEIRSDKPRIPQRGRQKTQRSRGKEGTSMNSPITEVRRPSPAPFS